MAKRIIWSRQADRIFTRILEFYIDRNGSKAYSHKLFHDIQSLLTILSKQPFIGLKTEIKDIRVFIKENYKIFYQIDDDKLIVHLVWDSRQNPESIIKLFNP